MEGINRPLTGCICFCFHHTLCGAISDMNDSILAKQFSCLLDEEQAYIIYYIVSLQGNKMILKYIEYEYVVVACCS